MGKAFASMPKTQNFSFFEITEQKWKTFVWPRK